MSYSAFDLGTSAPYVLTRRGVGVDSETCYGRDAWPTVFDLKLDCSLLLLLVRMPAPVALLPWCVLNEKG